MDPLPRKLRTKMKHMFATLNVNTLLKIGKEVELINVLEVREVFRKYTVFNVTVVNVI